MYEPKLSERLSEGEFEDKLNEIVKLIKQKEEINLELIEYLQQTLIKSEELSLMVFLHDEISKHKLFLHKINNYNLEHNNKSSALSNFYQQNISLNETEKALLRRVSARIIELFQSYNEKVEKYPAFEKEISNHYKLIKPKLLKQITQIDKNPSTMANISQLCNAFFTYLQNKFNDQVKKIDQIIELIENGEIHMIETAFICEHCKNLETISPQKEEENAPKIPSTKIIVEPTKSVEQTPEQKYFEKEKEKINEKLKAMRQEAKNKEALKKKKLKFATKYYSLHHHAMDIHKGFFIDEFTHLDENEQKSKILSEMEHRNKHNLTFIHSFIEECTIKDMEEKIAMTKDLLFSKSYEMDIKKDEEVKSNQSSKKRKFERSKDFSDLIIEKESPDSKHFESVDEYRAPQPVSHPELMIENEEKNEIKSFRITNPSRKGAIPTPKSNPNLFSIKEFGQSGQSFNFVKINMRNVPVQRARLPDISNRMLSTEERQKSSKMIEKVESNMSPNNNLLIIKTSLIKGAGDNKKTEKKKKSEESSKIANVIAKLGKNSIHEIDKIDKRFVDNSISPITINPLPTGGSMTTIVKSKNAKRSDSGSKIIVEHNERGSYKTLDINYSTNLNKKMKNFCETVAITESNE